MSFSLISCILRTTTYDTLKVGTFHQIGLLTVNNCHVGYVPNELSRLSKYGHWWRPFQLLTEQSQEGRKERLSQITLAKQISKSEIEVEKLISLEWISNSFTLISHMYSYISTDNNLFAVNFSPVGVISKKYLQQAYTGRQTGGRSVERTNCRR